jgi:O-antigen/teichoic acid export membrane protein
MFWRGVLGYLPVNVVQGVVGLLTIVVFTRVMTPAQYGAYALAFSATSLVYTALFTWLEAAMARFHAPEAAAGRLPAHFATIYRTFLALALGFPLAAGAILWLVPAPAPLKAAIGAGLASIVVRSLLKLAQERRRAAGEVAGAAVIDVVQTAGGFAIGAALALMGFGGAAPLVGAGAAAGVCLVWALPSEIRQGRGGAFEARRLRLYAAYGLPVALSLILSLVLATTDRFLLAAYLNEASVGAYHAGYSLANRTLDVIFIWLGMAGGPAAIAAFERGGAPALREAAAEQAAFMVALTLPAAAGLAFVARPLAELMIGPALREGAAHVTPWIAASAFLAGVTTYYFHTAFTLARRTRLLMLAMAVPALANLVLNAVLIPRLGLDGALWATLVSYVLGAGASWALGRRALALPIPSRALAASGLATLGMSLAVAAVPAVGGPVELFAKAMVGAGVYGLLAFALNVAGVRPAAFRLVRALQARAA